MTVVPRSWSTDSPPFPHPRDEAAGRPRRRRMGEVLLAEGVITAEQLSEALELQREPQHRGHRLGQVLALLGHASEMQVAQSLAEHLGLEHVDLSRVVAAPDVVRLLPQHIVERTGAIALDRHPNGALIVASSDPTNVLALDDVRLYTRCNEIMVVVATATQIREHLARAWSLSGDAGEVSLIEEVAEDVAPVREEPPGAGDAAGRGRPRRAAGEPGAGRRRPPAGQRHPPRAAARRAAHPVPGRRPAARRDDRARSGSGRRSSAGSRSWPGWTSPSAACRRTAAPASGSTTTTSTPGSARCRPCTARRS